MNSPTRARRYLAALLLLVVLGGGVGVWGWKRFAPGDKAGPVPVSAPAAAAAVSQAAGADAFGAWMTATIQACKPGSGKAEVAGALQNLATRLNGMNQAEAVRSIRQWLGTGADAVTGLDFKVGAGGALAEAPTMRTFLLEQLARLDPAAAAELGRSILASKSSPDEWAVALRDVARVQNDEGGRAYLEGKVRELLTHEPWQREPSAGYLEAFDVAVHLGGTGLVPELTDLVRRTNSPALSHAAYLTLDRLTLRDPAALLGRLADDPGLMAGREVTRANYFARAEVGDPAQRAILERYLLDERRSAAEWEAFAGLYPNANYMVSPNLLTASVTPDGGELRRRDRMALEVVRGWMSDPRFAAQRVRLERIHVRLDQFVRQAGTP